MKDYVLKLAVTVEILMYFSLFLYVLRSFSGLAKKPLLLWVGKLALLFSIFSLKNKHNFSS